MNILNSKTSSIIRAIKQRIFYIKNYKNGFSFVFLLPGFIREYFGENMFFTTLIKNNKYISIKKDGDYTLVTAGKYNFKFPRGCFYEGDFFDIIYPSLNLTNPLIDTLVYKNPYYESEGPYEDFGVNIHKDDFVIDAGANIGTFSIITSDKVGPNGKIFAFEPMKEINSVLEENITNNNCKNIFIENNLLGDINKKVNIFYNLDGNYNGASTKIKNKNNKTIELQQITLDNFVKNNNIKKIDFIKADIEGAERDMLAGAEQTIKKFKPKLAIRTYHLPDDPEVLYSIIKKYVPEYKTVQYKKTLYAWI
jgi:FkbM family methyltransferase